MAEDPSMDPEVLADALVYTVEAFTAANPLQLSLQEPELLAALAALKARQKGDADFIREAIARIQKAVACQICG